MRYANKIKKTIKEPALRMDFSAFKVDTSTHTEFTTKNKILMLGMVVTVGTIVYGSLQLGTYINEMASVFIISGIISSIYRRKRSGRHRQRHDRFHLRK